MPSLPEPNADAVLEALNASSAASVSDFVRSRHREALAARAVDLIDLDRGELIDSWHRLDEPRFRAQVLQWTPELWAACVDSLKSRHEAINDALNRACYRRLNWKPLRVHLVSCVPAAVNRVRDSVGREGVFPELWSLVANELARRVYAANSHTFADPEWRYLNGMLLSGYFAGCQFTTAAFVAQALAEGRRWRPLGLRGIFVRVPERICADGIEDRPPTLADRSGGVALDHAELSPILGAVAIESHAVPAGQGALHEIMPLRSPGRILSGFYHPIPPSQRAAALSNSFRLTEYNLLAYLALAGIEQLLRGWATRRGRPHLKPNGQPRGVLEWAERELSPTPELMEVIRELYDADCSNIRNRVMHGNLTEAEAKRIEAYQSALAPGAVRLAPASDPYHPENLAQVCLSCLERIDAAVTTAVGGLTADDLSWAGGLALTPEEIRFGSSQPNDFLEPNGDLWLLNVTRYLEAICPGLMPYWKVGFVGWMDSPRHMSMSRFMALAYCFEAMYRVTLHLLGVDILQRSHPRVGGIVKTQYKMLDGRETGVCTEPVLDRLVVHYPVQWKDHAKRMLRLAIKARNSIAHGAVVAFDVETADGLGNVLAKASQTLASAGLHHMVGERAYYRWRERRGEDGFDRADWLLAEREIMHWVAEVANVPRLVDDEPLSPFR